MSRSGLPHDAVLYPCSDGQPMAETQIHGECMMYVTAALRRWFEKHGRADVYVGSNNFLYYERGNPRAVVAPDVYVVLGAPVYPARDTYMLWNEPKGPDFVLEVTSASTRRDDERRKRDVYAALGVREYFLYDPRAEYLTPALQGFRLHDGEYRALPAVTVLSNRGVAVTSEVLRLELRDEREARMVRLHDRATGEDLPTYGEAERTGREAAEARRAAEARLVQEAAAGRPSGGAGKRSPRAGRPKRVSCRMPPCAVRPKRESPSWRHACGRWKARRSRPTRRSPPRPRRGLAPSRRSMSMTERRLSPRPDSPGSIRTVSAAPQSS